VAKNLKKAIRTGIPNLVRKIAVHVQGTKRSRERFQNQDLDLSPDNKHIKIL
jgi:hypothetical protein